MKLVNKFWILLAGTTLVTACSDLDTYPEGETMTSEQKALAIEEDPSLILGDINGLYALMGMTFPVLPASERDDDFGYSMTCLSSDLNSADMVSTDDSYNWFSVASDFSDRTYTYANPYMRWMLFYKQIKLANDILTVIPEDVTNQTLIYYRAQALAVRAFDYFNLIQRYQYTYKGNEDAAGIPIVTPLTSGDNVPRQSVQAVYDQILSDLNTAIPLLEGYVRGNKSYVDKQVAFGLRARVNLVMQNWAGAEADADSAMAEYTLLSKADVSVPSFNSADASSWMWGILIQPSGIDNALATWVSKLCSFTGYGYTTTVGCYKMINTLLWSKIPSTDVRKGWWVDEDTLSPVIDNLSWPGYEGQKIGPLSVTDIKVPFYPYTNVKFGAYNDEMGNTENASDWCIMRAEEMVLIKAEAMAMGGDLAGAKSYLESYVQTYRNPSYSSTAATAEDFQDEVWFQRRVELWGEGFGLFDLMRLKKNMVRFNNRIATNHPEAFRFNMAATDGWLLMRIPLKEINSNLGIPESANNSDGELPQTGDGAGLTDGVTD